MEDRVTKSEIACALVFVTVIFMLMFFIAHVSHKYSMELKGCDEVQHYVHKHKEGELYHVH